ncbi:MAG: radical SAM protein, partial [Bacteroidota bacterium]
MRLIRKPVLCNYYVTYRCNAKCGFCDIWERPSPYVNLDNAQYNLRDLKKLGVKVIDFTGGEPLLHRKLPDLLKMAKDLGFITTVTTNALLYPKYAEALRGKIDMLHFSLDSAEKEVHDRLRGVACFDFVMQSIDIARSLGEKPDILFTVFEENMAEIPKIYEEITRPNQLVLILNPVFDYNAIDSGQGLSPESLARLR